MAAAVRRVADLASHWTRTPAFSAWGSAARRRESLNVCGVHRDVDNLHALTAGLAPDGIDQGCSALDHATAASSNAMKDRRIAPR